MPKLLVFVITIAAFWLHVTEAGLAQVDVAANVAYRFEIRPLLDRLCVNCHGKNGVEGLPFLADETLADVRKHRSLFADVYEQIETGQMPPRNDEQFTEAERTRVLDWLKSSLDLKPSEVERIDQYVVECFQTKNGELWFGTLRRGAARFDGEKLEYFDKSDGLPSNAVHSFAEDAQGTLWAGTQNGVVRFSEGRFQTVGAESGLPVNAKTRAVDWGRISSDRQGNIWVSLRDKIYRLDSDRFHEFPLPLDSSGIASYGILPGRTTLLCEDRHGHLWFGTDGAGIFRYDGKDFRQFQQSDGLCSNNVTRIIEDASGKIWVTCMQSFHPDMTGDGGLCRLDGDRFTRFPEVKGLAENDLYSICSTKNGEVWIGASGWGAYQFDGKDFTLHSTTDQPYRTRNFGVQSILQDRSGTMWFGFSGGLFRFNGKTFYNIPPTGPWQ